MSYQEHKITLENGNKVTIKIGITGFSLSIFDVSVIEKGKRKERYVSDELHNDYTYRRAFGDEAYDYRMRKYLEIVSMEHLEYALMTTWEQMRPKPLRTVEGNNNG